MPKIVNDALAASGAINVELQDQHSDIVDLLMSRKLDEVIIQDDLTVLDGFNLVLQGHLVED